MEFRRTIRKKIRRNDEGVHVDGDLQAVISVNVGGEEHDSSSSQRVVQRSGPGARKKPSAGGEVTKDE